MRWSLVSCVALALVTHGATTTRPVPAREVHAGRVWLSFCWFCENLLCLSGSQSIHHKIHSYAPPGDGDYRDQAPSPQEACHEGSCYEHTSCTPGDDDLLASAITGAAQRNSIEDLRKILLAQGREVVVDYDERLLLVYGCGRQRIVVQVNLPTETLVALTETPEVKVLSLK